MSTTYKKNDIYITRRDTFSSMIKEKQQDGSYLPKVFEDNVLITMFIWETASMETILFEKTFTPDESGNITLLFEPSENDFEYGTYYYSLLQTQTDSNFRNTLIPESGETCDLPRYVVCKGDGDISA